MSSRYDSLLVSCCGKHNEAGQGTGGLVVVHEGEAWVIDRRDSTGLCLAGDMVLRYVRKLSSVWGYRYDGELRYILNLPEIGNGHDICLYQRSIAVVDTGNNQLCWYDRMGRLRWRKEMPGEGDAWHLNCLHQIDGRLYVSAFGRFETDRGWKGRDQGTGFVQDVATGKVALSDLCEPHSPRLVDGRWVVCESMTHSLAVQDYCSGRMNTVQMQGYTRGLGVGTGYLYVGESVLRGQNGESATVAVMDRRSLQVVDRLVVPFPEIYEVLVVPDTFAAAMVTRHVRVWD